MASDLSARAAAILARLREIDAACKAAALGPWVADARRVWGNIEQDDGTRIGETRLPVDRQFAAMSRAALPVLTRIGIAEVERAQGYLDTASSLDRDADESDHADDERYYHNAALNHRDLAKEVLDRWAPILEGLRKVLTT